MKQYIHWITFKTSETEDKIFMTSFYSDEQIPSMSEVDDAVEKILLDNGFYRVVDGGFFLGLMNVSTVVA